jgi:hypothetical protein
VKEMKMRMRMKMKSRAKREGEPCARVAKEKDEDEEKDEDWTRAAGASRAKLLASSTRWLFFRAKAVEPLLEGGWGEVDEAR